MVAILAIFVLPNLPRTTPWLTEEERQLAVWRLDEDIGEDDWTSSKDQTFGRGFTLAVKDPKMWLLVRFLDLKLSLWADPAQMLLFTCNISSASVTYFFPSALPSRSWCRTQLICDSHRSNPTRPR